MALVDEKDDGRRRKTEGGDGTDGGEHPPRRRKRGAPEVGQALRSAYQQTVSEDIPPEMLDLLGKLG